MSNFDIKNLEFIVKTTPEHVFNLLTDASLISQWSGAPADFQLKVGGSYEMFGGWAKGRINSFTAQSDLSYTWWITDWNDDTAPSTVNYHLEKHDQGTKVVLQHLNLPDQESADSHKGGWSTEFFDLINEFLMK